MKSINLDKNILILAVLAVIFFLIYSYLPYHQFIGADGGRIIFNSPDATGNYFFTKLLAEDNTLRYFEPLNLIANNNIHLRGVRVINSKLVPASFLGMILIYAFLAKLTTVNIIIFLTPFISCLAVIFFYLLLKEIFNRNVALISGLLLFITPAFWLYTSRSMFHNVLVIDFLIISLYFLVRTLKDQKTLFIIISSIFLGLAILCRVSEVLWLVPLYFIVMIFYWRKTKLRYWYSSLAVLALFAILLFSLNTILYGSALATGYKQAPALTNNLAAALPASSEVAVSASSSNQIVKILEGYLLPFGFHPLRAVRNFILYFPVFFWWFFVPTLFGGLIYLIRLFQPEDKSDFPKKPLGIYLLLFLIISSFLIIYYGGWQVMDRLNPDTISLGTSYIRYWLFIYIFSLPLLAFFINEVYRLMNSENLRTLVISVVALYFFFFSAQLVLWQTDESILAIKERISEYYIKAHNVMYLTEKEAIIISDRSDKIFFPERSVMTGMESEEVLKTLPGIITRVPVYYYTYWSDEDIDFWRQDYLNDFGLDLIDKQFIYGNESLYQVVVK